MEQIGFEFLKEDLSGIKNIVKLSYLSVKKKMPERIEGESRDEYNETLRDETLLEIADRLQKFVYEKQSKMIKYLRNEN